MLMSLLVLPFLLWLMLCSGLGVDLLDFDTLVSTLKDLGTLALAVVGAYVALRGLSAWRWQMKGKTEFEFSLQFLGAVYAVEAALNVGRSPLSRDSWEQRKSLADSGLEKDLAGWKNYHITERALYERRMTQVMTAVAKLNTTAFAARALWAIENDEWGIELDKKVNSLRYLVDEFRHAVDVYLRWIDEPAITEKEVSKMKAIWDEVFRLPEVIAPDPFGERLSAAVKQIEEFIRPKLWR